MREILTSDVVVGAFAALVALLLGALTELVRRQLRKVGLEVEQKEHQIIKSKVEEGVLIAQQLHRKAAPGDKVNAVMHAVAVEHVKQTTGKLAAKLVPRELDALVEAGVLRLKRLL